MIPPVNPSECQTRYLLLTEWLKRSGYSKDAFNGKRQSGVWLEGKHWIKSPDGKLQVDWRAVEQWIESNYDQTYLEQVRND